VLLLFVLGVGGDVVVELQRFLIVAFLLVLEDDENESSDVVTTAPSTSRADLSNICVICYC
jgi:hypothetical protein